MTKLDADMIARLRRSLTMPMTFDDLASLVASPLGGAGGKGCGRKRGRRGRNPTPDGVSPPCTQGSSPRPQNATLSHFRAADRVGGPLQGSSGRVSGWIGRCAGDGRPGLGFGGPAPHTLVKRLGARRLRTRPPLADLRGGACLPAEPTPEMGHGSDRVGRWRPSLREAPT